jgi:hypothetical protein
LRLNSGRYPESERSNRFPPIPPIALRDAAVYAIGALLIVYLGFREGGYEPITHEQLGLVAWWLLLLGVVAGVIERPRPGRGAMWIGAALIGLAGWSLLSMIWSESAGRTSIEVARIASYGGVFALLVCIQGKGTMRPALAGVATGIGVIAVFALMSRLQPSLFGPNELAETLPDVRSRLAYPLGYWNALGALVAMGLPLFLWLASSAKSSWARLTATAFVPLLILVIYLTLSRAGALAAVLGVIALLVFYPVRLALLPSLAIGVAGGLLLISIASGREALIDGLDDATASSQGDSLMLIVLLVMGACAGLQALVHAGFTRRMLPAPRRMPRKLTYGLMAGGALLLVVIGLAAGGPGRISDGFQDFKAADRVEDDTGRLTSASSNGRWQYWSAAAEAGTDDPLIGIGPGTFEFYWERKGELQGFIRDAHSMYVEVFAELGVFGLGLVLVLVLVLPLWGGQAALRAGRGGRMVEGAALAGAGAAGAAYFVSAGLDWVWEMPVVPVAALAVAAAAFGRPAVRESAPGLQPEGSGLSPMLLGVVALIGLLLVASPLLTNQALDDSRREFREGDYASSYAAAERAQSLAPYAAEPRLQQAYALEANGEFDAAAEVAQEAVDKESTNWLNHLVLARTLFQAGDKDAAREKLERARALNHSSFQLALPLREQVPAG